MKKSRYSDLDDTESVRKSVVEHNIATMKAELFELEKECAEKRDELRSQASALSDPKAREAFLLFRLVSKSEGKEDTYIRQRRITAAGLMAAAFLGLERYEVGGNDTKQLNPNK